MNQTETSTENKPAAESEEETPLAEQAAPGEEVATENDTAEENDPTAEVLKYKDMALRAKADLDNFRKRMQRDREDSIRYANTSLLERLLPILDNFELGLGAAKNDSDTGSLIQGLEMVQKQLQEFLKDSGVEVIPHEGAFDPNLHEAVGHQPSEEIPEGNIIMQHRSGYKLKDRLLRPATVVVSAGPNPSA
ncbi:MAG: nucleotide exchange factor GrpE [Chthoniobacterales bacterium]